MIVLFFGDSITRGCDDSEGGWVERLRKSYGPTIFINLGVDGDSSSDVLARFNKDMDYHANADEPMAIVFSVGFNDTRTKSGISFSSQERYEQNLAELLKRAKKYSDKILFVELTPCNESHSNPVEWGDTGYTNTRIKQFNATLRKFCEQNGVNLVDTFETFSEAMGKTELLPDGIHPNDEGHQLIADLVNPELRNLLNSR